MDVINLRFLIYDLCIIGLTVSAVVFVTSLIFCCYFCPRAPKDMDMGTLFRTDDL